MIPSQRFVHFCLFLAAPGGVRERSGELLGSLWALSARLLALPGLFFDVSGAISAAIGQEAAEAELAGVPEEARAFREFALGFNPLLAVPDRAPWVPYYGYGAGVVRLSLGDNSELGGAVGGGYVRWNFFIDTTVTVGEEVWVRDGQLVQPR